MDNYIAELDSGSPRIDPEAFVAPTAVVVGAVTMGPRSSIWYGAVARADGETIEIGEASNIQDGCTLHSDPGFPLVVGRGVTVGHRVVLHGALEQEVAGGLRRPVVLQRAEVVHLAALAEVHREQVAGALNDVERAPEQRQHHLRHAELLGPHEQKRVAGISQREDQQGQQEEPKVAVERRQRQLQSLLGRLLRRRFAQAEDQERDDQDSRHDGQEKKRSQLVRPEPEEPVSLQPPFIVPARYTVQLYESHLFLISIER